MKHKVLDTKKKKKTEDLSYFIPGCFTSIFKFYATKIINKLFYLRYKIRVNIK